ncbi:MAG: uroporphyrinogen decarboxylase [Thermosulfidibacteraceae bacterium]|jgi:uroporphyrinogen decarboxylase
MDNTFIRALNGKPTEYTPCWFMRQAGRFLPEYRAIRSNYSDFFEFCADVEKAIEVTYLPIRELKVDAAILFSDLLVPLIPYKNLKVSIVETKGPIIELKGKLAELDKLLEPYDVEKELSYVGKIVKGFKKKYKNTPLIGFCGAPFTVLSYIVEGGSSKSFQKTKEFIYKNEKNYRNVMENLTNILIKFAVFQLQCGADAFQIFDSWVGTLSPEDYREFVFEYNQRLIEELKKKVDKPIIYFSTGTSGMLNTIKELNADCISIDWRISLKDAVKTIGSERVIQGNLDPVALFMDREKLKKRVDEILLAGLSAKAHIFNLGHGILPPTDPETVKWLVKYIHEKSRDLRSSLMD